MFFRSLKYLVSANNMLELKVEGDIPSGAVKNRLQKQSEVPQK